MSKELRNLQTSCVVKYKNIEINEKMKLTISIQFKKDFNVLE